jgi:conjugal transfer/entry exclusion protein
MWDKIKNTALWISAVFGASIIIYKIFFSSYTFTVQKGIEKQKAVQSEIVKEQKIDQLIESNQALIFRVNNLSDTLKKVYDQNADLKKQTSDIKNKQIVTINGLTKHLEASKQTDELVELLKSQLQ